MKSRQNRKKQNKMSSVLELIGNTPLVRIGEIFAKLETTNPTGSVKDRMAWYMIKKDESKCLVAKTIGDGFISKLLKENQEEIDVTRELTGKFGILVGISSGANVLAARRIRKKYGFKNVITILPDRGERYLGENLF